MTTQDQYRQVVCIMHLERVLYNVLGHEVSQLELALYWSELFAAQYRVLYPFSKN